MSVIDAFDRLASRYDAWYDAPLGAFVDAREKDAVFGLAGVRPGERALDVGCGTGNYTLELARQPLLVSLSPMHPGSPAQVVGVDPAPAMLAIATRKAKGEGPPVHFVQAVAENLPFAPGSFDLVVSVTTLEFVASPEAAVAEMVRVVQPNGRLVVGVLNAWSLWALAYRRREGSVYEHAHFFSLWRYCSPTGRWPGRAVSSYHPGILAGLGRSRQPWNAPALFCSNLSALS